MAWNQLARKTVYKTPHIAVHEDIVELENGHIINDFSVVEFNDSIVVVATDVDGKLIAIDEYKYAVNKVLRTLPTGGIEAGATPEETAVKELREETGYEGSSVEIIAKYYVYPSKLPHNTYIARIRNAKKIHETEHEISESISGTVLLEFNDSVVEQFQMSVCAAALYKALLG